MRLKITREQIAAVLGIAPLYNPSNSYIQCSLSKPLPPEIIIDIDPSQILFNDGSSVYPPPEKNQAHEAEKKVKKYVIREAGCPLGTGHGRLFIACGSEIELEEIE